MTNEKAEKSNGDAKVTIVCRNMTAGSSRLVRLDPSFPMPPDSHQACFFRSSAITVSESINSTSPRSTCSQRR